MKRFMEADYSPEFKAYRDKMKAEEPQAEKDARAERTRIRKEKAAAKLNKMAEKDKELYLQIEKDKRAQTKVESTSQVV